MFSWGEARMGALGTGKHRDVRTPRQITFPDAGVKMAQCSAGYGHSASISTEGQLYTWGFNVYGQASGDSGDLKTQWTPNQIMNDADCNYIDAFIKVACSRYATYAIDSRGQLYSWGKGYIGHKGLTQKPQPTQIHVKDRIFTDVFANSDSVLFYAPIRAFAIEPKCGPSRGGTVVKITGTGFTDTDKMRVRFTYGNMTQEVDCSYNEDGTIACTTPTFQDQNDQSLQLPCDCNLSVTMDGVNYTECEEPFKIYNNDIYLKSVNPKCGSVAGGS